MHGLPMNEWNKTEREPECVYVGGDDGERIPTTDKAS